MTTFDDTGFHDLLVDVEETENAHINGTQVIFKFTNGWGASVIRGPYSYGGPDGLFELGVLDSEGHLNYDTPVAPDDVLGYLTAEDVREALEKLAHLTDAEISEFRADRRKAELLRSLKHMADDFRDKEKNSPEAIAALPDDLRSAVHTIINHFDREGEE